MLNFAVGPVQMDPEIMKIGAEEIPYFRTPEFSELMKENERMMLAFAGAGEGARALFLTGSGTAAMEAAVINLFTEQDKLLVVNGGSFGERFAKICRVHRIPHTEIRLTTGKKLTKEALEPYEHQGYTGFLVNVHETSTGVYYDMALIGDFCKRNALCLVADAISSFLADPFDMERWGVALMLTSSQKALALPPGLAALVLSKEAVKRVEQMEVQCLYLDLKDYLKDGERGQTPYTPAVGILMQLHERLRRLDEEKAVCPAENEQKPEAGTAVCACRAQPAGVTAENARIRAVAKDFRERIRELPFSIVSESLSNAETPLHPTGTKADGSPASAKEIVQILKDEYGIFVCPNGGALADTVFRVGHMGNLTIEDNQCLADALKEMQNRGIL